ncbi:MAG: LLM class F420-dependent oxidoreductase [Actinomycetota bacterium]|nr:LLM class F420-dependent oxidoreductase [Actinomycetota bacterium]
MKWGVVFSSTGFPDPDAAVALAQAAEEAGFESLWAPEHVVMAKAPDATPYRGMPDGKMDRLARRGGIPDPLTWLAFVASATSCIKLGTNVLIVPEHQPVVLAKTAATLDHLSRGRLILGIGVGELPEEYSAVGMEFRNRGKRMDEYIDAMRVLWRDDIASFRGEHVEFDQMECRPWPVKRAIPLHIGGNSDAAIRRAALKGDGYFPFVFPGEDIKVVLPRLVQRVKAEAAAAGRDPEALEFTSGGARTVEEARWYASVGIDRIGVAVRASGIAEMRDEVRRFGDEVIANTTDL